MKILQVLPTLTAGGAEGFVTNLGVSLARLGADVRFFLMAGVRGKRGKALHERLSDAGISVIGAQEHNIRSMDNILQLARLIRSWRPDIVQANMYASEVFISITRLLCLGINAYYVRRLAGTDLVGHRWPGIVRLMDYFFRQTIACAPAVADTYSRFMRGKYKSELLTIINGGLLRDAITTPEERRNARKMLEIPQDSFVFTHIGRMVGEGKGSGLDSEPKAQDVLLKSFAKSFRGNINCLLVLVGDGPLRPEAEDLAQQQGIARQVIFLGQQTEPWPALMATDVFCFPSRHEGLPNVLPEAASCGLPIVASDIPEIRSIYAGGAWLLEPVNDVARFAEAMAYIYLNIGEFTCRSHAEAERFRRQYSMKECAERYLRAYKSILGQNEL